MENRRRKGVLLGKRFVCCFPTYLPLFPAINEKNGPCCSIVVLPILVAAFEEEVWFFCLFRYGHLGEERVARAKECKLERKRPPFFCDVAMHHRVGHNFPPARWRAKCEDVGGRLRRGREEEEEEEASIHTTTTTTQTQ